MSKNNPTPRDRAVGQLRRALKGAAFGRLLEDGIENGDGIIYGLAWTPELQKCEADFEADFEKIKSHVADDTKINRLLENAIDAHVGAMATATDNLFDTLVGFVLSEHPVIGKLGGGR